LPSPRSAPPARRPLGPRPAGPTAGPRAGPTASPPRRRPAPSPNEPPTLRPPRRPPEPGTHRTRSLAGGTDEGLLTFTCPGSFLGASPGTISRRGDREIAPGDARGMNLGWQRSISSVDSIKMEENRLGEETMSWRQANSKKHSVPSAKATPTTAGTPSTRWARPSRPSIWGPEGPSKEGAPRRLQPARCRTRVIA
jgi:hypothetical protein